MKSEEKLWSIYHPQIPDFVRKAASSKEMQRLKGIDMNCGMNWTSYPLFERIEPYTRFDHSVGTALIIWHFTHSFRQTLSGLFHDIATPAFSHVVDFMHGDYARQESTEAGTEEIIERSDVIQQVLKEMNLAAKDVCDYHRYPIADNDSPRLSSDRLEYTLGDLLDYRFADLQDIRSIYEDLIVSANEEGIDELCFRHEEKGELFAAYGLKCSEVYTCSDDRYGMELLGRLLKKAIEERIISEKDLYRYSEKEIAGILEQSSLKDEWKNFRSLRHTETSRIKEDETWIKVTAKKRMIDPYVAGKGRTSALNRSLKEAMDAYQMLSFDEYLKGML